MSGFFYYLPNVGEPFPYQQDGEIDQAKLQEVGLGHLHDCELWGRDLLGGTVHGHGPDGGSGVCLYCRPTKPPRDEPLTRYHADKQTWQKGIGGSYWIGVIRGDEPRPDDLARFNQFEGANVTDTSRRLWQVPIARLPSRPFGYLPASFSFDDEGNPVSQVRDDCQRLWQIGGTFFDAWQTGQIASMDDAEAINLVMEVLAMNYRLGKSEVRLLTETTGPIIDSDFMFAATNVVSGFFDHVAKKKEEEETE